MSDTGKTILSLLSATSKLAGSYLLNVAECKLEKLAEEIQKEQRRIGFTLLWISMAVGSATLFLLFVGIAIVWGVGVEHRMTALISLSVIYGLLSVLSVTAAYLHFSRPPPSLSKAFRKIDKGQENML